MVQGNTALLLITLIGIYSLIKGKPHLAGAMFTITALIKIIPVFLVAYTVAYHFSRKVVVTVFLTGAVCLLLPAISRGPSLLVQDYQDYYQRFIKAYVIDGRIVADPVNHSLKAGVMKTFHPEVRGNDHVSPSEYPSTMMILNIMLLAMAAVILIIGIILKRRGVLFSLSFIASILLFTHLYSNLTWTAHMVTMIYCILPLLLLRYDTLRLPMKSLYFLVMGILLFLALEGKDLVGTKIYDFLRFNDIFTLMLLGMFLFTSWTSLY